MKFTLNDDDRDARERRRKVPTGADGHPLPLRMIQCRDCGRFGCLIPFPHTKDEEDEDLI